MSLSTGAVACLSSTTFPRPPEDRCAINDALPSGATSGRMISHSFDGPFGSVVCQTIRHLYHNPIAMAPFVSSTLEQTLQSSSRTPSMLSSGGGTLLVLFELCKKNGYFGDKPCVCTAHYGAAPPRRCLDLERRRRYANFHHSPDRNGEFD